MTIRELIAELRHEAGCDCPCDRCKRERTAAAVIEWLCPTDQDAEINIPVA